MKKDKDIYKELEEISPFLAKMKGKKEDIQLPDNYFHYLENSVMQQVELEETPVLQTVSGVSIPLWRSFFFSRAIVGFTSAILLIVAGFYFSRLGTDTSDNTLQFAELTDTEILSYLTENADALDIYSIEEENEDVSILDLIDLDEEGTDYLLEEISTETIIEEMF